MAHFVKKATGNLNDASGYYTSDVALNWPGGSYTWDKLDSAKTQAVTFATNHNETGVLLLFRSDYASGLCDRSIVVDLQEYVASVWTTRQTLTLTASQIRGGLSPVDDRAVYSKWVVWPSAQAVTTGSGKWRYQATQSGGTVGDWYMARAYLDTTDTSADFAASGEVWLPFDTTLTANASLRRVDVMTGAKLTLGNYTITIDTGASLGSGISLWALSELVGGSVGTPLTAFVLDATAHTQTFGAGIFAGGYNGYKIIQDRTRIALYGSYPSPSRAVVKASLSVGASSFKTETDITSWASGQKLLFSGYARGQPDDTIYTINGAPSYSGGEWTVNITPNLAAAVTVLANNPAFAFHHPDSYGVRLKGNSSGGQGSGIKFTLIDPSELILSGVGVSFASTGGFNQITGQTTKLGDPAKSGDYKILHCAIYCTKAWVSSITYLLSGLPGNPSEVRDVNGFCQPFITNTTYAAWQGDQKVVLDDILQCGWALANQALYITTGCDASNLYLSNCLGITIASSFSGVNVTLTGFKARGCYDNPTNTQYAALNIAGLSGLCSAVRIDDCDTGISEGVSLAQRIVDGLYLSEEVANTVDFRFYSGAFFQCVFRNEHSPIVTGGDQTLWFAGSYLHVLGYDDVATDFRSWTRAGRYVSNGTTKLTQKYASTTLVNAWGYRIATELISTVKAYLAVKCQIANAAFYAGTHTKPSITVTYDGSSTVSASALGNTTEQTLGVIFTPTTDLAELTATISGKTDAGTNGDVDWSAMVVNLRKYGKRYTTYAFTMVRIISDIILNLATLVTNAFITEANKATVAAYTGITVNHSTDLLTLTVNHTLAEVYDYSQYNLELDANMPEPEWLTTSDGATFASLYGLTIDNCTLSGTGLIDIGAKTLTLTGTGDYGDNIRIKDSAGTHAKLKVTGCVNGSRVRIEKISDGSLISQGTVSGTEYKVNYTHTVDIPVTIKCRLYDYLPYETTGIITANGLNVAVSMIGDPSI